MSHPRADLLARFAVGNLPGEALGEVETHVALCAECCQSLRGMPDDGLVSRLRQASAASGRLENVACSSQAKTPTQLLDHPRYRVVKLLGVGGMGAVYLAEHRMMERSVAIKVMNAELLSRLEGVERFRREVKAAARLAHPNIVAAYDADEAGDLHFLAMEYVDGISLARLVESRGPLPAAMAADYTHQAALGLTHAHERGMVHRDIKPQNLMVTPGGQLKILDFGLSRLRPSHCDDGREHREFSAIADADTDMRLVDTADGITSRSLVMGTADYLAPEQIRDSHAADIRADLYSLGCTLYFLLSGQVPFPGGSAAEKVWRHLREEPRPIEELRPDVSSRLSDIVGRLLAKNPLERFQTPAELAQALAPLVDQSDAAEAGKGTSRSVSLPERSRRPRVWAAALLATAMSLLAAALVLVPGPPWQDAKQPSVPSHPVSQAPAVPPTPRLLLVLVAHHFWADEYIPVRAALERAGAVVHVASTREIARPDTYYKKTKGPFARADVQLGDARAADYDAVIFFGGHGVVRDYTNQGPYANVAQRLALDASGAGKTVAAIGAGTGILAEAGLLAGKRAACGQGGVPGCMEIHKKLDRLGAIRVDEPVVVEGRIFTVRDEKGGEQFAKALLASLAANAR